MHKLDDDERDMRRDLAREMHLRVLRWDGERGKGLANNYHVIHDAYMMLIHACIRNGIAVGPKGIETHLRVISR